MTADQELLAEAIGVALDTDLLRRALTHRSYAYEHGGLPHNERLEFLGDSVLGVVVTETLYRTHPDLPEGKLAKLRASVVNMRALADIARGIGPGGLGAYLHLGRGEQATGGRDKSSILADALEALIGAVYYEHGLPAAAQVVHDLFDQLMSDAAERGARLDWKTSLQELTADLGLGVPEYVMSSTGPDHEKTFTARAQISGETFAACTGRSKKEAEQAAAEEAYRVISARSTAAAADPDEPGSSALPELPEVETVRDGLARWVAGRTVATVAVTHARAVRRHLAGAQDLSARLAGTRIEAASRRGKYLWLPLSSGEALVAHLGMSGQLLVQPPDAPAEKHLHVRIGFADGGRELRFVDQRTFGGVLVDALVPAPDRPEESVPASVVHIARDPLDPHFDTDAFLARLRRRDSALKRALLDQTLVSGIGNIYADEALWRARLHGERVCRTLSRRVVVDLLGHVRDVLGDALGAGGTSFDALYVNVNGESGYFDRSLAVYGREGEPCRRCGAPVRRAAFMNRSSFFCPREQRRPRAPHPH